MRILGVHGWMIGCSASCSGLQRMDEDRGSPGMTMRPSRPVEEVSRTCRLGCQAGSDDLDMPHQNSPCHEA